VIHVTALAGSVPSGQSWPLAQSAAKLSNAFWNAAACRISSSIWSAFGVDGAVEDHRANLVGYASA